VCALEIFTSTGIGSNPASARIFCVELKYILLIRYFQSLKNATEFGHIITSKNGRVFTKGAI
jgi:hypothetical protein